MRPSRIFMVAFTAVAGLAALLVVGSVSGDGGRGAETSTPGTLPALRVSPQDVPNPVLDERPPPGFRQLLGRDSILPVYEPEFVAAADAGWRREDLVIGVEIDGDARAYPVAHLNAREMVIDRVAGIPVLVTW